MMNIVRFIDCMDFMADKPDNYYDLAIVDPPYNIKKAKWDSWKCPADYINYIIEFFIKLQRIMKDNSSIYLFHNDFNQLAKIQTRLDIETDLILRQFIVWNKRFEGSPKKGYFDGYVTTSALRNYQKLAEYICFYTFQDETGLTKIMGNCVYPIRNYIRSEIIRAKGKIVLKDINIMLGTAYNGGGVASAVLSIDKTIPAFITKEHYLKLREWLNGDGKYEYLRTEYEELRTEYEELRTEYEELRYYFSNQKTHHSIWNYDIEASWHPTPKPKQLIKNILMHSARPDGIVFNPFNGSENIRIACHDLGFDFEGCEIDPDYWQAQEDRYNNHILQAVLFGKAEMQKLVYGVLKDEEGGE